MGYVAVNGGQEAIEESLNLLEWERVRSGRSVAVKDILAAFPDLIDQIMGESSLYAPELAALALKQAQGSPEEAVFLLRAFRSTLERPYTSRTVETETMLVKRRISAAFKDIPGGQVLGATRDYSHRLIDFDLRDEDDEAIRELKKRLKRSWKKPTQKNAAIPGDPTRSETGETEGLSPREELFNQMGCMPKVADYLRREGLIVSYEATDDQPMDVTMEPLVFPAPRSARLQTLARGMTQAVGALGYAAIRGFGPAHPTVAELRYGSIEITIAHPLENDAEIGGCEDNAFYLGSIPVTEVESLFEVETKNEQGESELAFDLGYGMVMGRAETKAIAMSVLDNCLMQGDKRYPTQDEEFVLYHVDGIEATGFISHLKLPHYVTFQSKLSSVRKTREETSSTADDGSSASANAQATDPIDCAQRER